VPPPTSAPMSFLENPAGITVHEHVPLAGCTTWKTGGLARYLIDVESLKALREALLYLREMRMRILALGNGSNVLIADAGFDGAVIRLRGRAAFTKVSGELLEAGAGAPLGVVALTAARASLGGLEFSCGIPGTVGGAVMTNAGASSGSTALVLAEARALTIDCEDVIFDVFEDVYRQPLVPPGHIVTSATFRLGHTSPESIKSLMSEARSKREATQPVGLASAGCVFKNPAGDSAGRLLEECGVKGASVGRASVSRVHANFIINNGGARADDIKKLMGLMALEVESRFAVRLEPEVRLIGFEEEFSW